jgi:hypothetical protein
MNGCYCIGPQNGEPLCPCQMRAKKITGDGDWTPVVQSVGWKCPVCGKGNAPFQKTCANPTCGITWTLPAISSNAPPTDSSNGEGERG